MNLTSRDPRSARARSKVGRAVAQCIESLESRVLLSGTGAIQVSLFNDVNRNNQKDATDAPLAGWTVYLDDDRDGVLDANEPSLVTDAKGQALFTGLGNGKEDVREILPAGWSPAQGFDAVLRVNVNNDETTPALFLNTDAAPTTGTASGTVWNDVNGDGVRQPEDPGIPGWTVFVDLNTNKFRDAGEPSAVTDAGGVYTIPNLAPGDYKIREVTPTGWDPTLGSDGANSITIRAGSTTVSDFGNFNVASTGSLQGTVWNDVNADGLRAAGDPGLGEWTVFLDLNASGTLDAGEPSTVTDAAGVYTFPSLIVGTYRVAEVLQAGWNAAPGHPTGVTVSVVNEGNARADFANFTPTLGSISGTVWDDANGDGSLVGESGLSGWTIYIDQNSDGVLNAGEPSAVTDDAGKYLLADVAVGSNVVREIPAIGWSPTAPGTGMQLVQVRNATAVSGVNFGNKQRTDGAIGGTVYFDANRNGARDAGERGLAGITVYLDLNDNGTPDAGEPTTVSSTDLFYTPGVDETGRYGFTHLPAGTFRVRETLPAVLSATPTAAREQSVTLAPGESRQNVDFADLFRPNEIHGLVFDDANKNHVRDPGEAGIPGVTVYLDVNRNNVLEPAEPRTVTGLDGTYAFTTSLAPGSYVVRQLRQSGRQHSYPTTTGGILWPSGVSNPAVGNVSPTSITTSLAQGQSEKQTVSLTLPGSGSISNMVDVFLLFDDTGSFTANSPIVRSAFPQIIGALQAAMPGVDFGFGVGRFEEYANFAAEFATGRPFILNQPIVAASTPGFSTAIQAALDRTALGYGGDTPETDFEALFQVATGRGFDGNNNGTTTDSGAAGLVSTQLTPGGSGDVPAFTSFTVDPAGNVLPAAGTVGGAGFRTGALPIILVATDTGFAFQPAGETSVTGVNGLTLPISALTQTSRPTTPFASGAGIQETITALNALGALVIGLGTNGTATVDPRQGLEALAKLTGATNRSLTTIPNGTLDPIAPGDPFYFQISSGFAASVANGIVSAIENGTSNVAVDIAIKASDPRVQIASTPGVVTNVAAGQTATFDVTFTGDGRPHSFDLQFVRAGTDVVLGSIPVVIGTPIPGDGYEYEDLDEGEIADGDDFGNWVDPLLPANVAPSFTRGADQTPAADTGAVTIPGWATDISAGPAGESDQVLDFIVTNDNNALFSVQPAIAADGTLTYTLAPGVRSGTATVTVRLHDSGGSVGGGEDTSAAQTFTIAVAPPTTLSIGTTFEYLTRQALVIDFSADVAASLTAAMLEVRNVETNQPVTARSFAYDPALRRATLVFDAGALADGNYRLTITAGALPGQSAAHQFDFFALAGDANQDRTVNFTDLLTLAKNYNQSGKTFADGDFNYDGSVNFADLLILAKSYNKNLAAATPPAATVATAPVTAPVLAAGGASVLGIEAKSKPIFSITRLAKPVPAKPAPAKPKAAAKPKSR